MTKVLIVDDEAEVRQFLSRSLAGCGYSIREARDGNEALACVATDHPDVVITDLLMPVMDGFELALRIRANPDHAGTQVIFFTGRASPREVQAMAETAGVNRIVTKPATIDEVQEAVGAAVHRRHAPNPAEQDLLAAEPADARVRGTPPPMAGPLSPKEPTRSTDHRFRAFFAHSLDAILLLSSDGRCLDANEAALELLGYERETLLRLTLWDLTPVEGAPAAREVWRRFLVAGQIRGEYRLIHGDGARQNLELSAVANIDRGMHLTLWRPLDRVEPRRQADSFTAVF